MAVEVKIGIADSSRELTVQSTQTSDEAYAAITAALSGKEDVLALTDEKGSRYLVPTAKIAYAEVGNTEVRRVGFGA